LAISLKNSGKLRESIRMMERALSINVELNGDDSPVVLTEQAKLAQSLWSVGRFDEANALLEKTVAKLRADPALAESTVVDALDALAESLAVEQTTVAAYVLKELLGILERFPRKDRTRIAQTLQRLAETLNEIGRSEEAEICIRRAIRISEKTNLDALGIAKMYALLAEIQGTQDRYPDAVKTLGHSIALRKTKLGPQYPDLQYHLLTLANYLRYARRKAAARKSTYEALRVGEMMDGKTSSFASLLGSAAMRLLECDDRDGAMACLRRALAFDKRSKSANNPNLSFPIGYLAQCLFETGKNREAEALVRRAIEIDIANPGSKLVDHGAHLALLSRVLAAENKYLDSIEAIKQAIQVDRERFGKKAVRVAMSMSLLAMLYQKLHRPAQAVRLMRQHVEMLIANEIETGKKDGPTYLGILKYGALLRMQGKPESEVQSAVHALPPRLGSDA
jgi:tetratricopeptide (TPR) repeat protein